MLWPLPLHISPSLSSGTREQPKRLDIRFPSSYSYKDAHSTEHPASSTPPAGLSAGQSTAGASPVSADPKLGEYQP